MAKNDLNLALILGVKNQGVDKSLDNVISLLKKLEQAGKESGKGTAIGAKQAAEGIRALKLETQASKAATESAKKEQVELKNALLQSRLEAQKQTQEFKNLKNQLAETNKSAELLNKTFGLLGGIISVGIIIEGFKKIAGAASEATESENLFEVSLGKMANSARAWSNELSKTLGLNAYEVRKNIGTFNVMLGSMGLGEKQAYEMSKAMTKLAYDMASFYNLSNEEAFEKIKSGLTGEMEPLKALGIILSETMVKQAAYAHGIAKQGQELTEVQKIQARYITLMEQTSKAQGDLERTADSTANMTKRLEDKLKDLSVSTGKLLLPALDDLIKNLIKFMDTSKQFVEEDGAEIKTTFETIASSVKNAVEAIVSSVNILNNLTFGGFSLAFSGVLSVLNTASYLAAKLAKQVELLQEKIKQSSKTSGKIETENEIYQRILKQKGLDKLTLGERLQPENDKKLHQAYLYQFAI